MHGNVHSEQLQSALSRVYFFIMDEFYIVVYLSFSGYTRHLRLLNV